MNHWERVTEYVGKTVEVYNGRLVTITGISVPGNAFCRSVDDLSPIIGEVCTSFLTPDRVRQ